MLDRPAEPSESMHRDARSWVVLLASGRVTASQAEAFRRWHDHDAAHAQAFAEAKADWEIVGAATQELAGVPGFAAEHIRSSAKARVPRRWLLGGGLVAASLGAGLALTRPPFGLWSPVIDFAADYRTGIGERRTIELPQDVTVELTTRSRMALGAGRPEEVHMALLSGEASVSAGGHPVKVTAGPGVVQATQGRFDLRNDDGAVRVTCLAGSVDVTCGGRTATLGPARQIAYGEHGLETEEAVDPAVVTAWQRGMLVFHNQRLGRVVEEVNRYRPGRIVLLRADLAARPVAVANFYLDRLDQVVPQIEALYGVKARYLPGGIVLLG
jgi:transmembrane sensor